MLAHSGITCCPCGVVGLFANWVMIQQTVKNCFILYFVQQLILIFKKGAIRQPRFHYLVGYQRLYVECKVFTCIKHFWPRTSVSPPPGLSANVSPPHLICKICLVRSRFHMTIGKRVCGFGFFIQMWILHKELSFSSCPWVFHVCTGNWKNFIE